MTRKGAKQKSKRSTVKADEILGTKIRLRRVEQKLSQEKLGDALGVSFQQVQKYEKGVNRVGASRLIQIAKVLDVPVSFFYNETDKQELEVESLLAFDSRFSLRLLKAYTEIKNKDTQHHFVSLLESIVAQQKQGASR